MITRVTGVHRDVSQQGGAPLAPYAQPIRWPLTEDGTILIDLVDSARQPVAIGDGVLTLTVRRFPSDEDPMIVRQATIIDADGGRAAFPLVAGDTREYSPENCSYDVWFLDEDGLRSQVVPTSPFQLSDIVSRPGEPQTVSGISVSSLPAERGLLAISSDGARSMVGQNEELVDSNTFNFGLLDASQIYCSLSAITMQTAGATGTYRVRVGGTPDVADGTIVAAMDTTHAGFVAPPDLLTSASFARPSGAQLVKLTARASVPGAVARIRHYQIAFKTTS